MDKQVTSVCLCLMCVRVFMYLGKANCHKRATKDSYPDRIIDSL